MAGVAGRLARRWCRSAVRSPLQVISFPSLQLHLSGTAMRASQEDFESAMNQVKLLKKDPGNEVKLRLYALYKQATEGPCNMPKPRVFDFINKAKWDAWNALGSLPKETARQNYVDLVSSLTSSSESSSQVKPGADRGQQEYENLVVTSEDGITKIMFNRPTRKNAISTQMYQEIMLALKAASKDDSTITVVTGNGDYYCSGNDLANFTDIPPGGVEEKAKQSAIMLRDFVGTFIDFPKPLVAVVNGPAVGISVTILGLFDAVYATDRATFHTPFSHLGLSPEGCASYTFPKIMGPAKRRKFSAHQLLKSFSMKNQAVGNVCYGGKSETRSPAPQIWGTGLSTGCRVPAAPQVAQASSSTAARHSSGEGLELCPPPLVCEADSSPNLLMDEHHPLKAIQ